MNKLIILCLAGFVCGISAQGAAGNAINAALNAANSQRAVSINVHYCQTGAYQLRLYHSLIAWAGDTPTCERFASH